MELNSLTATEMRNAVLHALAISRKSRTDATATFLDELHRRGFAVVPVIDAGFEEASPKREPRT